MSQSTAYAHADVPDTLRASQQAAPTLIDPYGRRIDYLRVSVTDRCDLRCHYCLPQEFKGFQEPTHWLSHPEMLRLVRLFVEMGIRAVRLTGGEPLTRRGVSELAAGIACLSGVTDLAVSTNGTRLARYAEELKQAGVRRLNVSLDTMRRDAFQAITGQDRLQDVLDGLEAARHAGFSPIKINCVVHRDTPEADLADLLTYTLTQGFVLRLIEVMPMGDTGRRYSHVALDEIAHRLANHHRLTPSVLRAGPGPARYWATADGAAALGVITPMSQHFCAACNRVRLSVDGTLYLCLGQERKVELGAALRSGASDPELQTLIREGIAAKPERHDFVAAPERVLRFMSHTGG